MRISDWSSDVCSSDLLAILVEAALPLAERLRIVQAQDLQVRHPQAGPLDRREGFGQGRAVAAGEDVLAQPLVRAAGRLHPADGMDQGDAVVDEQFLTLREAPPTVEDADQPEHADRNPGAVEAGP